MIILYVKNEKRRFLLNRDKKYSFLFEFKSTFKLATLLIEKDKLKEKHFKIRKYL